MKLKFRLKYKFFSAFRELFVHHHGSLDFRAKVFALIIAAHEKPSVENYILVKKIADEIYKDDEDRAKLLLMTTKEIVEAIHIKHSISMDNLVYSIMDILKHVPRYAKKIDIDSLKQFLDLTYDEDTLAYQTRIIEFLENLKNETLKKK